MRSHRSHNLVAETLTMLVVVVLVTAMLGVLACSGRSHRDEQYARVQSINNVRSIATLLSERSIRKGWPGYNGKNFVLSLVAMNIIDTRRVDNLSIFFSPGDATYSLEWATPERFKDITKMALMNGNDFHDLTSYAGRRNHDRDYMLTRDRLARVVPIICDDDEGALHHLDGLVMGFSDGSAKFVEWAELDMAEPDDPNDPEAFLGDSASSEMLRGLSSE